MTLGQPGVRSSFGGIALALLTTGFAAAGLDAQHRSPSKPSRPTHVLPKAPRTGSATKRARPDQNSASRGATHDPRPELPPLVAWHFVKTGNAAFVATRQQAARLARHAHVAEHPTQHGESSPDGESSPHGPRVHQAPVRETAGHQNEPHTPDSNRSAVEHSEPAGHDTSPLHDTSPHTEHQTPAQQEHAAMPTRPAGAGKYVCAVITCADMPFDVADLLGLERKDVLVMRLPALMVRAEAVALLDRAIQRERLSLVLVLSHDACDALSERVRQPDNAPDALDQSSAALRARAAGRSVFEAAVRHQREQIVESSNQMRRLLARDRLRILPGVIDARTGQIAWKNRRTEAMPMSPVK